ncbi:hypothetical protein [Streptomyces sp. WMMC500]
MGHSGRYAARPHGYVAWAGADPAGLDEALRRWFGEPDPA